MDELEGKEKIKQYQMLEYNHLVDRKSKKSIFSVKHGTYDEKILTTETDMI